MSTSVERPVRPFLLVTAILSSTLALAAPAFAADDKKPPTTFETAEKLLATGALPEAARAYAAFAHDFPKDPRAPRAFADAVILNSRLGLVDLGTAELDLQHFENTFVPVNIDLWAEMSFSFIDGFTIRQDHQAAMSLLHRTTTILDDFIGNARKKKTADLQTLREIEVRARGRLAHLYSEIGDHQGADAEYARIQKLVPLLGVWPGKKPPRHIAKFPETMELIAESFFHVAEQKRFEAERLHLPSYIGNGDRDSVLKFVTGPGEKWYKYRQYAVEEANRLYAFVLGAELPKPEPPKPPPPPPPAGTIGLLGGDPNAPEYSGDMDPVSPDYAGLPPPSPRWAIAAAERVGSLWSNFVREFRTMPIPIEWKPPPGTLIPGTDLTYEELKGEYFNILDSPSEGQKQQAKHAYKYCVDLSVKERIVNEHTDACIRWLSRNYGAEYHEIDDFAPPGEFFALGSFTRPAPLPLFTH